jgi:hypothetical protein
VSDDLDREDDYRDDAPGAISVDLRCECGATYLGLAVCHDHTYDSPGWVEPEPGEELCPDCREGGGDDDE